MPSRICAGSDLERAWVIGAPDSPKKRSARARHILSGDRLGLK